MWCTEIVSITTGSYEELGGTVAGLVTAFLAGDSACRSQIDWCGQYFPRRCTIQM